MGEPGGGCHRTRGWAGCAPVLAGTRGGCREQGGGSLLGGGVVENKGGVFFGGVARNNKGGVLLGKGGGCKEQKGVVLWEGL